MRKWLWVLAWGLWLRDGQRVLQVQSWREAIVLTRTGGRITISPLNNWFGHMQAHRTTWLVVVMLTGVFLFVGTMILGGETAQRIALAGLLLNPWLWKMLIPLDSQKRK